MSDIQEQFTEYVENNPEARAARDAETIRLLRARVAELEGLARACLPVVRHKEYTEEASCNPPEAARWRALADRINAAVAPKEAQ